MGWDAYATQDGQDLEIDGRRRLTDPDLRKIFADASAEVVRIAGFANGGLLNGGLDGWACKLVLELATGAVCFEEGNSVGEIVWSSGYVQELWKCANWDIPMLHEEELSYPDWYDATDYWATRVFLQTCGSHNLGITFDW